MRKLYRFVIIIIFLLLTPFAFAQTNISGGDVSGTWTKANSPYNINGEITIPNDSTLIIEPGVEVIFTGHYKFNVQGRLLAIGTETDTILFTINDTTGFDNLAYSGHEEGGWGGIKLRDIASSNDSTIFEYCSFQYGKSNNGGAIYARMDKLRISHCLFRNNLCLEETPFGGDGGAIYILYGKPIIEYCEFYSNKAQWNGSALYIVESDAIIRNNHFHHNTIAAPIGIIESAPIFINNLIEQNHSNYSSILYLSNDYYSVNAVIINNTIVNNTCTYGAISAQGGLTSFINNVVYGNEPSQVNLQTSSSISFYNCLIEGGKEGFTGATFTGAYENCIDADPQFLSSNDYHLQNTSPCIGSGIDSALINSNMYYCPSIDFEGNPKPNPSGSMPDIGAYENTLALPEPTEIPAGNVSGTWTKANSPYNINGEITILNDSTLTIEPGVEVVFTGHYKFNVQGRLLAIGTETDTIVFTINDTTGFHNVNIPDGGWSGIRFMNTPSNNDSSKLVFCKLQYGKANTGVGEDYDMLGGAICAVINKLLVSHCLFRKNTTFHPDVMLTGGGCIFIEGNPTVEFCEFTENTSSFGSAICIWGSNIHPLIKNNYFHHNGGHGTIDIGSLNGSNTSPVLINNIIANNHSTGHTSTSDGHGIVHFSNGGGKTVLINNTIVNNSCDGPGGAIFTSYTSATPLLINNIICKNTPAQVRLNVTSGLDFYNCLIEGGQEGFTGAAFTGAYENCIDADPQFVSSNDYHLQDNSPCIGAGIDSILISGTMYYCPSTDYEGNLRPNPSGTMPDIGAYENVLGSPLPVELISFTATATSKEVTLNWSTATELSNQCFEVQRKFGSNNFVTVGSVKGHGTTTSPNNYSFIDKLIDGGKYFYRLKQIDYDGSYEYSNEIEVEVRLLDKFNLEQNYPNPFNPTTTIGYVLQEKSNAKLTILNSIGEEVAVLVNGEQDKGYHKVEFDGSKISSGVYFYKLSAGPSSSSGQAYVETKKMILLK